MLPAASPNAPSSSRPGHAFGAREGDQDQLLHDAASSGNLQDAREALANGASVDAPNHQGLSALHLACANDELDCAALLLSHGAKAEAVNSRGDTPLFLCAYHGSAACLGFLIAHGADINHLNSSGQSPLSTALHHSAQTLGAAECALALIHAGADISHIDRSGERERPVSALHLACLHGQSDCVRALLALGADPEKPSGALPNPLQCLACSDCASDAQAAECAALLIGAGALLETSADSSTPGANTPLLNAIAYRRPLLAQLLLDAGASLDARGPDGDDALSLARANDIADLIASIERSTLARDERAALAQDILPAPAKAARRM